MDNDEAASETLGFTGPMEAADIDKALVKSTDTGTWSDPNCACDILTSSNWAAPAGDVLSSNELPART
jgi:hypothetical protein